MNVNDFKNKLVVTFDKQSRIIAIPKARDLQELCSFLRNDPRYEQIRIGDFIEGNNYLPDPDSIFEQLEERLKQNSQSNDADEQNFQKVFYVTGVNGLLNLWNSDSCRRAHVYIKSLLDNGKYHIWIFVDCFDKNVQRVFSHPRYQESNQMLYLGGDLYEYDNLASQERRICLVGKKYLSKFNGRRFESIKQALKEFGAGTINNDDSSIFIGIDYTGSNLAGIKDSIEQAYTLRSFFKLRYNLFDDLSDSALQWLIDEFDKSEYPSDVLGFIRTRFFPDGIKESSDKLPRLIRVSNDTIKELLFWAIRMNYRPDCYLSVVLKNPNIDYSNFSLYYVCQAIVFLSGKPIDYLHSQPTQSQINNYIEERKSGIEKIDAKMLGSEISQFIDQAKSYPFEQVAPWLNNNSNEEKCEIIRRIIEMEQVAVPSAALKVYPLLDMYLQDYIFNIPELNAYFSEYRTLKIKNRITEDFCNRAANINYPPCSGLKYRDEKLQTYFSDNNAGLIIVDALSAEYLPMLIALAKSNNIGLVEADVCVCRIPTSTAFNPINWNKERLLPPIKAIDNTIHDGEEKHVSSPFENNFVALLDRLYDNVLQKTSKALEKFERVILTSDHGSTRLAVTANVNKMAQTLPVQSKTGFTDWRYTSKESVESAPDGTVSSLDGDWYVVKGYNRFSKQGAKYNECHGGLTYEEVLVPFLVFQKSAKFQDSNLPQNSSQENSEFVENEDFDI